MEDDDRRLMARKGAAMAFCPSSNLFLGSGLFDLEAARRCGARVGAGSDVGGGTSLSMLRTLGDAYKVSQLKAQSLSPFGAFYLTTLECARTLYVDNRIGNFATQKEADFVLLDAARTALTKRLFCNAEELATKLFALYMLGDNQVVTSTYIMGQLARIEEDGVLIA
jgi:guanine deaminase